MWRSACRQNLLVFARQYPPVFFPLMRLRQRRGYLPKVRLVNERTDLVIEGYYRTATHYVASAFELAANDRVSLAVHTHAPASVKRAAALGRPTLVLVRPPTELALSNYLKHPNMTLRQTLNEFARFYSAVLPYRDRFVAARFDEATSDINRVIERVNQRFGTTFPRLDLNDAAVNEALTKRVASGTPANAPKRGRGVSNLPSDAKEAQKDEARAHLRTAGMQRVVQRAEATYQRFLEATGITAPTAT